MKIAVLFIYLITSYLAISCEGKQLYFHANGLLSKLWSQEIIRESQVRDTISGVGLKDNIDNIKANYGPETFNNLLEVQCTKIGT